MGAEAGVSSGWPEDRLQVIYLVARNMERRVSVSAIEKKLAGLAFFFKLVGGVDWTKDFWAKQALKGYRKGRKVQDNRRPVSFSNLYVSGRSWTGFVLGAMNAYYSRRLSRWCSTGRSASVNWLAPLA